LHNEADSTGRKGRFEDCPCSFTHQLKLIPQQARIDQYSFAEFGEIGQTAQFCIGDINLSGHLTGFLQRSLDSVISPLFLTPFHLVFPE
jgi:hypothetical protein